MSTIKKLFSDAAATRDAEQFKALAREIAARVGERDAAGVYIIRDEYQTLTSRALKPASLNYPENYYEHVLTRKYVEAYLTELRIKYLSNNLTSTRSMLKTASQKLNTMEQGASK